MSTNFQEMNGVHEHLKRGWLSDRVHEFRAWFMATFFTPVMVTKCVHEWKIKGYKVFHVGKKKYTTTRHVCEKCKVSKMTNFKY